MTEPKRKAAIRRVGSVIEHATTAVEVNDWGMYGGDFPGCDIVNGCLGGWPWEQLAVIARIADLWGIPAALEFANSRRDPDVD